MTPVHWQLPPGIKRALFAMALAWAAFVFALLSQGCAPDEPADPAPDAGEVSGVCWRAFSSVLGAWVDQYGARVPAECEVLDRSWRVALGTEADMAACPPAGPHQVLRGCTSPTERTVYVLGTLDEALRRDVAIHEWVHVLSHCVDGDLDRSHSVYELWMGDAQGGAGFGSVEGKAQADAPYGDCL